MYTNLKNVQVIISLLKQHEIRHFVLSPGTRNTPLVHSIENDDFFNCYSIVDERSAAYFALGLSEKLGLPVGFSCTSSTATCNYLPAIEEAAEKKVPLLALTADRDNRYTFQMEDQSIRQDNLYEGLVSDSTNIPVIKDDNDLWFTTQSVNRVLINLIENSRPCHINFQVDDVGNFNCEEIPVARKITKINSASLTGAEINFEQKLKNKKILVICGQRHDFNNELFLLIKKFNEKFDSILSYDHFSNIGNVKSETFLKTVLVTESISVNEFEKFTPDIVITIGGHFWSFIKYKLRWSENKFEHWIVSEDARVEDGFKRLTYIFNTKAEKFFEACISNGFYSEDKKYQNQWIKRLQEVEYPNFTFSNFSVIKHIVEKIPAQSILHTSILNSTRLACFCELNENVLSYSNIGADGIDGTLSTYLAQGNKANDKLSFLVIGDLSFIYDVNSITNNLNKKHRILVINNYVGSEFYTNFGKEKIETIDKHIAAKHSINIEQLKNISDVYYISASNDQELKDRSKVFLDAETDKPVILEVFTDPDVDAKVLKEFYRLNYKLDSKAKVIRFIAVLLDKLGIKEKIKNWLKR